MPATGSERRSSTGMDSSRRLSASSDGSLPDRDRQFLQEHVESIPTRLPKLTSSKPAANPLQFVKVGPCDLYRSAQEQIRKVEEVKKIKQKRDEAEDWQSNLDNWKNSRRKRQEHIIERVVEVKKFELEEYDRNRKRSKTFSEMMEERSNRGRKVSLVVYKDDDDKDLSDLGIGANPGNLTYGSDENDTVDLNAAEDVEGPQDTMQHEYMNSGQNNLITSQDQQEFTYEQAIQSYVNFAETRVRSKNSSRNEQESKQDVTSKSEGEERPNDVGAKKERSPPPVAPKPRKYSLKLEETIPSREKNNSFAEDTDHISDASRKLSLPQVDVLKRREVFEKSLTSKEHSIKNKPAELLDSKSVKERLSSLGVSSWIKSTEPEMKPSRQLELPYNRKPTPADLLHVSNDKLENKRLTQNHTTNDTDHLEGCRNEQNLCDANFSNNSVYFLVDNSQSCATDLCTSDRNKVIVDQYEDSYSSKAHENTNDSSKNRTTEDSNQNRLRSENVIDNESLSFSHETFHADRWKLHRSLDSLDRNYCDDMGSEILERVQSLDGIEHCNIAKDYPLSASSMEMLGSLSNCGDTDREDSGIHTADVSCSISQTDEYGDQSAEMSNALSQLLVDNNVVGPENHDAKGILAGEEFSDFLTRPVEDFIGTKDASRISTGNCTSYGREAGVNSNVSSQPAMLHTDASSLHDSSLCTTAMSGDGRSSQEHRSESNCTHIPNEVEFLSDVSREENSMQPTESSVGHAESELVFPNTVSVYDNTSEYVYDTMYEDKMETVSSQTNQCIDSKENNKEDINDSKQCISESDILVGNDSGDSSADQFIYGRGTDADKLLPDDPSDTQGKNYVACMFLDTETVSAKHPCLGISSEALLSTTGDTRQLNGAVLDENDIVKHEETWLAESSDRNSPLNPNASHLEPNNMVMATSEVDQEREEQKDSERKDEDVLVQKIGNNGVDIECGDGELPGVLSACISTKDLPFGTKEVKEEVRDLGHGYSKEQADIASSEGQKSLTCSSHRNEDAEEVMLKDQNSATSSNGLGKIIYDPHLSQEPTHVVEEAEKYLCPAELLTKDLKNLRIQDTHEVMLGRPVTSTAQVKDTCQIIHKIPPLNLSSEVEIVAGLTFPLGPVAAAEPPKEKPPPPPDSDDEHIQSVSDLKRIDSTKRIKKEIRRKRTDFLGIEESADDSYLEPQLKIAPPPDMTTFLMEEQRLQKQLYRQSICSESDSNLGETTDSRDSGVELEKGNVWAPQPTSADHSRQNSQIYGYASIASEDDEIAKKEREIIEILEKEEQWQHGHSPNSQENIGEELSEKLWQLEQDNLRLEWEKEAKRRELEAIVQRREEEMRVKERETGIQQHEAMLQMERARLEREAEIIPRHKDLLPQPQQWGNKGRLSLQDISVMRHLAMKHTAQFPSKSMLPEYCQSMPDLQQAQDWKSHSPSKSFPAHHSQPTHQDWREKENLNRNSWKPAFSPVTQHKDFPAVIKGQQMTRQTLQALSAVPRPRLIPTENWIQAKRKPESKRGTFNSQHWLIQEAEQRRITEQQQRNALASQKMPTSQLSHPLHWMQQQPQQKKPLPDSVINTLSQRMQSKVDKKFPNRTRPQDNQIRDQIVGHHNVPRPNGNIGTMNCDQTEKMLSVSGKKKCSHCGEELGRGAAMIIESLRLFYHIDCFKCCVCHIQLGDGLMGTDVRVRNNKLHCHNCYSSEDGVKFSCV